MCQVCAAMKPYLLSCEYEGFASAPVAAPGDTVKEGDNDAPGSTTTTAILGLGEFFVGELSSGNDSDWIEVTLEAGTYTIAGVGLAALSDAVNDITLTLRNSAGNQIDHDDISGPGLNAELTVTVTSTTTYYIDVGSFTQNDAGTYGVSLTEGTLASYSDEMAAGNLMRPNQAWVTTPGDSAELSWAFRATGNDPSNNTPLVAMNANQITLTQAALAYVDAVSGLNLTQVAPGGTSNSAVVLIGAYDANDGAGAYAYYPGSNGGNTSFASRAGDVWLNTGNGFGDGAAYGAGTFTSYAILHELGHVIGLGHPGDYNAGAGENITYGSNAQYSQDSQQYSIMSYFDEAQTGASGGWDYPDTFMLHDYMALQALYGADLSYNAGDSTYGFNVAGVGAEAAVYDFNLNTTPFLTIYDGAGNDTIDLSGYAMANSLSLEQGVFSDVGGYVGRFSIAYGADIENAVGGSGNDTMTGNELGNMITGGAGADTIVGGMGDDSLIGGTNFDYLDGGEGMDTLVGNMGSDTLLGGDDRDLLSGGNGNDYMVGGMGNDRLIGGRGNDELLGGGDNDRLIGGTEDDILDGGMGNDLLRGGRQNDTLKGGEGNDTLIGGSGFDALDGGIGDDILTGAFNADRFIFANGNGKDTITDFDANNDFEKIDFSGHSWLNTIFDVLGTGSGTAASKQVGADVEIDTGGGNLINLLGVNFADLDTLDFTF